MDDAPLLARIDRRLDLTEEHIRQGNEHMRQGNEHMRRGNEFLEETRDAMRENARAIDDLRTALNQWNLRQEKMMRSVLAELADMRKSTQEMTASIREWRYEGVEEARAQRAALFAILDQMKGGGGTATA
jgi:methyl-accepting chemotaxis protein